MRGLGPWGLVAAVVAGALGATLGWVITSAGCGVDGCPVSAGVVAALVGIGAAVGAGIIASLTQRSLHEHEQRQRRGLPPQGAGCEQPEDT